MMRGLMQQFSLWPINTALPSFTYTVLHHIDTLSSHIHYAFVHVYFLCRFTLFFEYIERYEGSSTTRTSTAEKTLVFEFNQLQTSIPITCSGR